MNRKIIAILAGAALILGALAGCRSTGGTPAAGEYHQGEGATSPAALWDSLTASYGAWTDVEMPVKVSLRSPSSMSFSGQATMVEGQAVSISLRKIGFEVATVYINSEKVVIISRPLRVAWTESVASITRATGITLADIQSALLGRVFVPGAGAATAASRRSFELAVSEPDAGGAVAWSATPRNTRGALCFNMVYAGGASALRSADVALGQGRSHMVQVAFGEPEATEAGPVASDLSAEAQVGGRRVAASIEWKVGRAKWNAGATAEEPAIPANCRRITTAELLNLIRNF